MSPAPYWLAAAVSIAELDAASFAQFMISRPVVVGPALGTALGRSDMGLLAGFLVELLGLDDLPIGGHLPVNGTIAVSCALLLALGPQRLPLELALPAGLVLGWLHGRGESFLRQGRANIFRSTEIACINGEPPRFGFFSARSMAIQSFWTALFLCGALKLLGPVLGWFWELAPQALKMGLNFGLQISPSLALAGLLSSLWATR